MLFLWCKHLLPRTCEITSLHNYRDCMFRFSTIIVKLNSWNHFLSSCFIINSCMSQRTKKLHLNYRLGCHIVCMWVICLQQNKCFCILPTVVLTMDQHRELYYSSKDHFPCTLHTASHSFSTTKTYFICMNHCTFSHLVFPRSDVVLFPSSSSAVSRNTVNRWTEWIKTVMKTNV